MMHNILALDIGATNIKAALFDAQGNLLRQDERPSHGREGGAAMMNAACEIIADAGNFAAIGISVTGQVDAARGRIVFANDNVPGFTGFPVRDYLQERFPVPVAVENDVNAAALGEAFFGAARDVEDFLCVTLGTGVGGAVVIGRRIYGGADGVAGEVGHMVTHPGGLSCACGQRGCYEQYASASALVRSAQTLDACYTSGRAIFADLEKSEGLRHVVDAWIDEVLVGLTTLTHIFNPRLFVLGGGVAEQPYVLGALRERLPGRLIPSYRGVRLVGAQLGNMAGAYGALHIARLALEERAQA